MNFRFPGLGKWVRRLIKRESPDGILRLIQGQGNRIQAAGVKLANVELDIVGDNNQISFGPGSTINNLRIRMRGSNHRLEFGENCRVSRGGWFWFEDQDCLLKIGANTTLVDVHIAVTEPGSQILIGDDCMLANDIDIRTGDSHSVIDIASGERLNFPEDVTIENHVWIAPHVVILKGVSIGSHSVIATGSIVTRSVESGVIAAGNPANVIRTGITWERERIAKP
jgi:acetyltransferase-like isoleucine patch superfamily enzyme